MQFGDAWFNQVRLLGKEQWATGSIQRHSQKDGGTDIDTVIEEERPGEVSTDMKVYQARDGQHVEADEVVEDTDPVCIDQQSDVSINQVSEWRCH